MDRRKDRAKQIALIREQKLRTARTNFYEFCCLLQPKFFRRERLYLRTICDAFQGIYDGTIINEKTGKPYRKLALSVPPSHGKSFIATLFSEFVLGKDKEAQIINVSYNERMSAKFGQQVRDGIMQPPTDRPSEFSYSDVFPETKVKYGDASKQNWSIEGRYNSFLATSFSGTLTGFRGNIGVIDDPVKNALEAFNENRLQEIFEWYADTFLSRVMEGGKQIIIQTRWSKKDLIGRMLEIEPGEWLEINLPAFNEKEGTMLCEEIMSRESYESKKRITSPEIFLANYQQETVDAKNKLYGKLQEYSTLPDNIREVVCVVDPADTGDDSLVAIIAAITKDNRAYVKDIYMTQDNMDITQVELAKRLTEHKVKKVRIERNSAGRLFASNVEKQLKEKYQNRFCMVETFNQKSQKESRIYTYAHMVDRDVFFPLDLHLRHEKFYKEMNGYQRVGKNAHDDAPDASTMLCEYLEQSARLNSYQGLSKDLLGL